jgi:predicted enzyme related to lactoylglutathione lyase
MYKALNESDIVLVIQSKQAHGTECNLMISVQSDMQSREVLMPSYRLNPTVAIEVPDCEKAVRFYRDVLGMSEASDSTEGEGACLVKDDVTLFLIEGSTGNTWLRLTADDPEGARKQLEENGCRLSPVPGGYLVVDPHGTRFYMTAERE